MIPKLILAPMAGFTDAPFRALCRRYGADLCVTEMVSSVAMTYKDHKTSEMADLPQGDTPTSVQLFGHDPDKMEEATRLLLTKKYYLCKTVESPYSVDINMGCPVRKIFSSGDGSALMKDPALAGEIVKRVKKVASEFNTPVSVKMRLGVNDETRNVADVARSVAENGADIVAVHLRTREEMYRRGIHIEYLEKVKNALPDTVELWGNGDVESYEDAKKMCDNGCDGVMIGRAALGKPWLFDEIKAGFKGEEYIPLSAEEKIEEAINLVRQVSEIKGERIAIPEARGRAAHFIHGMRGAAEVRDKLNHATSLAEFEREIRKIINK